MKRVVLVAAHYPPSNLAAVHRARLWAQHLPEFGWRPTILTTHHRHYEETLDWELARLTAPDVTIIRTAALPAHPFRVVGDIGIRSLPFHYRALAQLARDKQVDFVHITIPSFYSALLGRPLFRQHGVRYGIDYIDPWVHPWPGADRVPSKAWASSRLADTLEPWAVHDARLITGVAADYYKGVLDRNPHLRTQAVTAAMPYGGSERDFDAVRAQARTTFLFQPADGLFHVVYAGAMLPHAYGVLDRLFAALARLRERQPGLAARLRLHFVGTGKSPDDPAGHNIAPLAARAGVEEMVDEHPPRIGYVDVLNHLLRASAVLVLGSTDRHYTPSKAFQAVQSGRPVMAVLHEASTAAAFLRRAERGPIVTFAEGELPQPEALVTALVTLLTAGGPPMTPVDPAVFEGFSARASAGALATALDAAAKA